MCKRNSPEKNKANMGCVTETPEIRREMCKRKILQMKMKPAWDV